ncbi:MAG: hypothetical protein ACF8CQ_13195 [Rhodopirellula sp. JB044]|uniref:hypothetical protein n=1 Tax=Rhodopirellula sp. JB044 TaxID=3342844 RepID=UPI00370CB27A
MPVIQCPSCQKSLNLKQMPAGGRIKCPACGSVIPVGGKAPSARAATRPTSGKMLTPEDEGFDFGQIQFPSAGPVAVSTFPSDPYGRTAYQGPIQGDPLGEYVGEPTAEASGGDGTGQTKKKAKGTLSPLALAAILGGTLMFVLLAIVIGTVLATSGGDETADAAESVSGSPSSPAADVAAVKANGPAGYDLVEIAGAVIYMPQGRAVSEGINTVLEYKAVESTKTESYFFFGSMPETAKEVEPERLRKRIAAQLKGGYIGGTQWQRNGYGGIKGRVDQSPFVSDMQVETFHVDGRIFVVGYAPFSMGADPSVQMSVDRGAENEEIKTYQDSFTVGPKPKGGLFW